MEIRVSPRSHRGVDGSQNRLLHSRDSSEELTASDNHENKARRGTKRWWKASNLAQRRRLLLVSCHGPMNSPACHTPLLSNSPSENQKQPTHHLTPAWPLHRHSGTGRAKSSARSLHRRSHQMKQHLRPAGTAQLLHLKTALLLSKRKTKQTNLYVEAASQLFCNI